MIWVLLQSESPLQHNDPITFFYLSLCFSVPGVFFKKFLKEVCVPAIIASIMVFCESVLEIFFNNHKNIEIAC